MKRAFEIVVAAPKLHQEARDLYLEPQDCCLCVISIGWEMRCGVTCLNSETTTV